MNNLHKFRVISLFLACSVLLSSCSSVPDSHTDSPDDVPDAPAVSQTDKPKDENVPDNVVDLNIGSDVTTSPDEGAESPDVSTQSAPPVDIPTPNEPETDESGQVIDDWRTGLNLSGGSSAEELYQRFGIDGSYREGYYRQISAECAFPIVHISTENNTEILSRDEYVNCLVEVFNCDDIYKMEATEAEIRVRGNASAFYGDTSKLRANGAPYRIRFYEKQSMLGLNDFARCRSWVLLKTFETGVRDHLAYKIAEAVNNGDYYVTDAKFVQVYVNEKYEGIYVLCEQTQANSNRVDIAEAEEGYTGTDIGYLVELDNYATSEDNFFYLNYNKEAITDIYGTTRVPVKYAYSVKNDLYSDEQLKFIERYFEVAWEISMRAIRDGEFYKYDEDFNLIPAQSEFSSAYECVNNVFDVESVVDMYITYEITNDQDLGGGSFFFAVDFSEESKFERLTMVAPWDFDWAYSDYNCQPDGGIYAAKFKDSHFIYDLNLGDRSNPWLILFYSADWFRELVKEKWQQRLTYISSVIEDEAQLVVDYSEDFDKDGKHRASRAMATVNWARDRVEYLNTLWG